MSHLYVYAITHPNHNPAPTTAIVPDTSVCSIDHANLSAWVSEAPSDFLTSLENQDRAWLTERVIAHQQMLTELMVGGTVLPFRFGTVVATVDDVRTVLINQRERWLENLARLDGCEEWGLKVQADLDQLAQHLAEHAPEFAAQRQTISQATMGKAYLLRKKLTKAAQQLARQTVSATLEEPLTALARQTATLSNTSDTLLNRAYLVVRSDWPEFQATISQLRKKIRAAGFYAKSDRAVAALQFCGVAKRRNLRLASCRTIRLNSLTRQLFCSCKQTIASRNLTPHFLYLGNDRTGRFRVLACHNKRSNHQPTLANGMGAD